MSQWSIDWPHVAPCPLIGGCANRHARSRIRGRGTALQLCYLCHLNEHPSVKYLTLGQLEAKIMLLGLQHGPMLGHRNLRERYHTQTTELTATSIRATQTLTDAKTFQFR